MNRQIVALPDFQQVRSRAERIDGASSLRLLELLAFFRDKSSTDGVIDAGVENSPAGVKCREAHSVAVTGEHDVFVKDEIFGSKRDLAKASQAHPLGSLNRFQALLDFGGINFVGLFPKQAEQNTAIGAVAHSGQCQRAIELDLNTLNGRQKPGV